MAIRRALLPLGPTHPTADLWEGEKKDTEPIPKRVRKNRKKPSDASAKKRGDYEDGCPKTVNLKGKRGETKFRSWWETGSCDLPSHLILCDLPRPRLSVQSQCHLWKRPRLKQLQTSKFEPNKVSFKPNKA